MNLCIKHDAVCSWEVQNGSRRVMMQSNLSAKVYQGLMMDDLEDLSCLRLRVLEKALKPINQRSQNIMIKRSRMSNPLRKIWTRE